MSAQMNIELQIKNLFANSDKLDEDGFIADFYYIANEYVRQQLLHKTLCDTVCHICGGSNGHTIDCTSWCGNTVTI
jgi:uncharacterized protein (DUF427 family)